MKKLYDNSTGHIIADFDGKLMLVDTGTAKTFYDEYQGIHINALARMVGQPLDGVLGMDDFKGKILALTSDTIHLGAQVPARDGVTLEYVCGIPCVDIKINGVPCRAMIKTGVTTSCVSDQMISRDKHTRTVNEVHPFYGELKIEMFVNYFSIGDKSFFADVGQLPDEFSLLSSVGAEAVIGTDLLKRFNMIMDFSGDRLHLVSS